MQTAFSYSCANMIVILFAQRQLKACDVKAVHPSTEDRTRCAQFFV
jgi:hypothetical protein